MTSPPCARLHNRGLAAPDKAEELSIMRWIAIAICCAITAPNSDDTGVIEGTVVNGSQANSPLTGAKVVLRASHHGAWVATAETTTDDQGKFRFEQVPVARDVIYLPGANHEGIHYPGQRVTIDGRQPVRTQRVVVYETVAETSPLVAERHEIDIRPEAGALIVTETMTVKNPSLHSYVGTDSPDGQATATLRLSIPSEFEKVTFEREFFGRQFQLNKEKLETQIPWTPGVRELKFTYRLPLEHRHWLFRRPLDLPTEQLRVCVHGGQLEDVTCNLASAGTFQGDGVAFESEKTTLPSGHAIELRFGNLPVSWTKQARWIALSVLVVLMLAASVLMWRRRGTSSTSSCAESAQQKCREAKCAA
jgi:hypothetical protein